MLNNHTLTTENKMTLQLKSANEVYDLVERKEIAREIALEYARNKREYLRAKNKNRRAMLWSKCIEKIEADQDNIKEADNNIPAHLRPDFKRMTAEEKLSRGMVMKKIDGCKMYFWPMTYHGVNKNGVSLTAAKQRIGAASWA